MKIFYIKNIYIYIICNKITEKNDIKIDFVLLIRLFVRQLDELLVCFQIFYNTENKLNIYKNQIK